MQRLFSTFADGQPGAGLLIQRYGLVATPGREVAAPQLTGALAGLLLIAGFWTPLAGVVAACAEGWVALSSRAHPGIAAALAVLGVTLALIGARRVVRRCPALRQEAFRPSRALGP